MDAWRRTLFWSFVLTGASCLLWYKRVVLAIPSGEQNLFVAACAVGFLGMAVWIDSGRLRVRTSTVVLVGLGATATLTALACLPGPVRLVSITAAGFFMGATFFHLVLVALRTLAWNRRGTAFAAIFMCAGAINTTTDMRTVRALYVHGIVPNLTMATLALVLGAVLVATTGQAFDVRVVPVTAERLGTVRQIAAIGLLAAASFILLYASLGLQESITYPEAVTRVASSELIRYIELPLFLAAGLLADRLGRQLLGIAALVGALIGATTFLAPDSAVLTAVGGLGIVFALSAYPVACVALMADASCYAARPALLGCLAFAPVVVGHLVGTMAAPVMGRLGGVSLFLLDAAILVGFVVVAVILNELIRTNFMALRRSTLLVEVPDTAPTEPDLASIAERHNLTRREQEVLTLSLSGLTVPQMAARLFVTETTVKFHITNLLRKTGTNSRSELTAELAGLGAGAAGAAAAPGTGGGGGPAGTALVSPWDRLRSLRRTRVAGPR
ncbi:MAG: LuxR C-terminal-related transcriptional regulator [Bifidobacteriaceae bacterium]|jgi:DNA-binding CsgD family transcriptional regulator|nr:LuxR C-terminal-related transcriptional regulator [Bifidobacteriaceae bacterium]